MIVEFPIQTQPNREYCPRCAGRLRQNYITEPPECGPGGCGYVENSYTPPERLREQSIYSGTEHVLRYSGRVRAMRDIICSIRGVRTEPRERPSYGRHQDGRFIWEPSCPFDCDLPMERAFLSGRRVELLTERYMCAVGHRISLITDNSGNMTWT